VAAGRVIDLWSSTAAEDHLKGTILKFMLMIYGTDEAWDEAGREKCYVESAGVAQDLHAKGKFLATAPLYSAVTAKSVRVRAGKAQVTDGPFAETREQLGGFFLIDVDSEAEALEIASRIPGARVGTVEVREVLEVSGIPQT
jgi:hypothetical protein